MTTWRLSLQDNYDGPGPVSATITVTDTGEVTATGDGLELAKIIVFVPGTTRPLGPADGEPWLLGLADELGKNGTIIPTLETMRSA